MKQGTCKELGWGRRLVIRDRGIIVFLTSCIYFDFALVLELSTERLEIREFEGQHRIKTEAPCSATLLWILSRGTWRRWELLLPAHPILPTAARRPELSQQTVIASQLHTFHAPPHRSMGDGTSGWERFNRSVGFCKADRCSKQTYYSSHRHKSQLKREHY